MERPQGDINRAALAELLVGEDKGLPAPQQLPRSQHKHAGNMVGASGAECPSSLEIVQR
jgi:hypothetical protein